MNPFFFNSRILKVFNVCHVMFKLVMILMYYLLNILTIKIKGNIMFLLSTVLMSRKGKNFILFKSQFMF